MVVQYTSGSEGSVCSFFTVTPFILFRCRGSVVPLVLPQILVAVACSFGAHWWKETQGTPVFNGANAGFDVIGVLLAFLMVFKTQTAYQQFWQASGHVDGVLQLSRSMAMSAVSAFTRSEHSDQEARRIIRLLTLHYFTVIEFFMRTGANATRDPAAMNRLRSDIRMLTGEHEFLNLYPDEDVATQGSLSSHRCANPTKVLFWVQLCVGRVFQAGECAAPIFGMLQGHINGLMSHFWSMNKIDKTQFPLPYSQIVKILVMFYVFTLPARLIMEQTLLSTTLLTVLAAVGFFGLDEVAEILESPLGNDPNDLNLRKYGRKLLVDLSMIYEERNAKLDTVFASEDDFDLSAVLEEAYSDAVRVGAFHDASTASLLPSTTKKMQPEQPQGTPPTLQAAWK
eukprot:TRINITY_DN59583_c0_g1_i1.p1 TRINITY_DN59583_c0_g1~~TRINITY_DN59583_c0_g1_i1.p1  ORF type:complete len:397 (+),score=56.62 TRINITY_DN59583_c0_g1_i1:78-1268(+)